MRTFRRRVTTGKETSQFVTYKRVCSMVLDFSYTVRTVTKQKINPSQYFKDYSFIYIQSQPGKIRKGFNRTSN